MINKIYARGLNFMGQLGIGKGTPFVNEFVPIPALQGYNMKQVEAHFTQSYCLTQDNQILHFGWIMDSLTTARTLSFYKKFPTFAKYWQSYSPFGKYIGLRAGMYTPNLLNRKYVQTHIVHKFAAGGSFLIAIKGDGIAYSVGENYKGQLGVGDSKYKMNFTLCEKPYKSRVIDVCAGLQHSLVTLENGMCYASGRRNWQQFKPYAIQNNQKQEDYDFYPTPVPVMIPGEQIKKASAGFQHSLFLTQKNKLYSIGMNNHGQCGVSNLQRTSVGDYNEVFTNLKDDEYIVDMACGKSHNIFYTNKNKVYGFGAASYNQFNSEEYFSDICSPKQIQLNMGKNERIVKIKAGFDRNAVLTNEGNCYVWGGDDFSKICGDYYSSIVNIKDEIPGANFVKDVGLGFMHTIAIAN